MRRAHVVAVLAALTVAPLVALAPGSLAAADSGPRTHGTVGSVGTVRDGILSGGASPWVDSLPGLQPSGAPFEIEQELTQDAPRYPVAVSPPGPGRTVTATDRPQPTSGRGTRSTDSGATASLLPPDPGTMTLIRNFAGPTDFSLSPPDPDIAAGTYDLLTAVNATFVVYDKSGAVLHREKFADFFAPWTTGVFLFDPTVVYDKIHNRFFIVVAGDIGDPGSAQHGYYYVAVSTTTHAKDAFYKYRIDTTYRPDGTRVNDTIDWPKFGTNGQGVYITSHYTSGQTALVTLPMSKLLTGAALVTYGQALNLRNADGSQALSVVPATAIDDHTAGEYMVNAPGAGASHLLLWRVNCGNGCAAAPVGITSEVVFVPQFDALPPIYGGKNAAGQDQPVDVLPGTRLLNAYSQAGYVYTAHAIRNTAAPARSSVRWYEIYGSFPATVEWMEVADPNLYLYNPTVAPTPDRNVTIVYNYSSATYLPGVLVQQRFDSRRITIQGGLGTATRMGDYTGASPDTDGATVWVVGHYGTQVDYGTKIGAVRFL